jgi:hypothetical protein
VQGIKLKEMELSDMLDVIHYFFEEDLLVSSSEESEAKTQIRSVLYREMYGTTYKYGVSKSGESYNYANDTLPSDGLVGSTDEVIPDPMQQKRPTRAYTPTTDFDADSPLPFGRVLDQPESR